MHATLRTFLPIKTCKNCTSFHSHFLLCTTLWSITWKTWKFVFVTQQKGDHIWIISPPVLIKDLKTTIISETLSFVILGRLLGWIMLLCVCIDWRHCWQKTFYSGSKDSELRLSDSNVWTASVSPPEVLQKITCAPLIIKANTKKPNKTR